ncbi:mannose-6-phosphate isomerase, class I [Spirilliplanes yamanashiensis]|uniref:mannose-6-phosphate isomerase n=1 Tax=Spirilliplanes yamanashiensis TaxID=42233 RepID=A0A8J4DL55_9ACTN|nr:mannose-6-phosphate isomerase, class I [Spirilliplanes yamanashiensis]MDP9816129.1 mannose-6-phosphate isomerase [Spirilliplanes yamanashiensis]GIJ05651.1 putative mannose-6-phosphate isomerase ManA [Spirilliplanes yamanashiensis]
MHELRGAVRPYAWGSTTFLAGLQGRAVPSDGPEAELWLGAHPGDPATVELPEGPARLDTLISADPKATVGERVVDEFGARLPYLLKVLAADAPLSLQAHPTIEQAREGYAAEQAGPGRGIYTDPNHKPELLVALTPFAALCGFRAPDVSAAVLTSFGLPELAPVVAALRAGPAGLRDAVAALLTWPEDERRELVARVVAAEPDERYAADHALATDLAAHYPADTGVLVALLLNHVRLEPGEAIWMPAGNLHAYLRGAGVEIMAASDNVLRGGLTPKRIEVDELLRVLRFEVLDDPVVPAEEVAPGVVRWPVPIRDFALHRVTVGGAPVTVDLAGPRIALGAAGAVTVDGLEVAPGRAGFAPAEDGPLTVAGAGVVYIASAGV